MGSESSTYINMKLCDGCHMNGLYACIYDIRNTRRSKKIVTTNTEEVATVMQSTRTHLLYALSTPLAV